MKGGGPSSAAKAGSQRGGPGGPCDHCARTFSPCWRKGPPEKPLLCNACGAHYLVKKSLDGYKPGQKSLRSSSKTSFQGSQARSASETAGNDLLVDSGGTAALCAYGAELIGNTSVTDVEQNETDKGIGKRRRTANKRYNSGEANGPASKKPQGLTIRRVSRQDSDVTIADTPMAVNLLADMANRRKQHAPPPLWELTSPRGIEEARKRTFNALMKSPHRVKHTTGTTMKSSLPPTAAAKVPSVRPQPSTDTAKSLAKVNAGPSSAVLSAFPYVQRSIATSPSSPITMVEMVDIIGQKSWAASAAAYPEECQNLSKLLPACDRSSEKFLSPAKLFSSPAFAAAMDNFQQLIAAGMFDAESGSVPAKVVEHYRRLFRECNLLESKWANNAPLTGKQRRLAKQIEARSEALQLPSTLTPTPLPSSGLTDTS